MNTFSKRLTAVLAGAGTLLMLALPMPALAWWNHDWAYRKQIVIDAGSKDAEITGDVSDAVVLLRLHEGVLTFTDANAEGADLRFVAGDDKTPLKYHIEKFDSVFNLGFVWVHLAQIKQG